MFRSYQMANNLQTVMMSGADLLLLKQALIVEIRLFRGRQRGWIHSVAVRLAVT